MKNLKMVLLLLLISSVCALILGGTELTYTRAAHIFQVRIYARILELFEINSEEGQAEAVFSENFETELKGGQTYFIHKESGIVAFKAEGPGLWSRLEILLAFYPEFEKMYGLRVLAQAETPGLGGRIAEPEFQERFAGVDSVPDIRIVKFAASSNQVDAVAGATKTSAALEAIINTALSGARKAFEK